MSDSIGSRIAKLRRDKGITQDQLAERMGVSPQAVSKWENGIACPDISLLPALAGFFGISIDELLTGNGHTPAQAPAWEAPPRRQEPNGNGCAPPGAAAFVGSEPMLPARNEKDVVKIRVRTAAGDTVQVSLPLRMVEAVVRFGSRLALPIGGIDLSGIDLNEVLRAVEAGASGEIVDVQKPSGEHITVVINR